MKNYNEDDFLRKSRKIEIKGLSHVETNPANADPVNVKDNKLVGYKDYLKHKNVSVTDESKLNDNNNEYVSSCTCSDDEPCHCLTVNEELSNCKDNCEANSIRGLYAFDTPDEVLDFDEDTKECKRVWDEDKYKLKFERPKSKCLRKHLMSQPKSYVEFEDFLLPLRNEIVNASFNQSSPGWGEIEITVHPRYKETYLKRFMSSEHLGKVYLVLVDNSGIEERIVLSEDATVECVKSDTLVCPMGEFEFKVIMTL